MGAPEAVYLLEPTGGPDEVKICRSLNTFAAIVVVLSSVSFRGTTPKRIASIARAKTSRNNFPSSRLPVLQILLPISAAAQVVAVVARLNPACVG
jgi:hypothetical protein